MARLIDFAGLQTPHPALCELDVFLAPLLRSGGDVPHRGTGAV